MVSFVPHPPQKLMIEHTLEHQRCANWASMGFGKTGSVLYCLDALQLIEPRPTLALAPKRVARSTWPREVAKWGFDLPVSVISGTPAERSAALRKDAAIYTMNYDNLPWLVETLGDRWPFGTVVADEATRLKNFRLRNGGVRAQQLGRVAHKHVDRWINLTGTPAPNGLHDLWGQTWFLDAGQRLGRTYDSFQQRWFRPKFDGYGSEPLPYSEAQIHEKLRDICLTLDAADWFDVQQPIVRPVYVDLPDKARQLYAAMEKEMFFELAGNEVEAFSAATATMKCLQIASGAVWHGEENKREWSEIHDAKLAALESIIEEANGMPVLCAYHWKPDLARILKAFPKARELDDDPRTEDDWNAGKIPLLVAHPASAGHGLNLQDGGNILAVFSHWWDLEQYQQIVERIGPVRQLQAGHNRPVWIYPIVARDTVDELVMARRESKRSTQDLLLEAMKRYER